MTDSSLKRFAGVFALVFSMACALAPTSTNNISPTNAPTNSISPTNAPSVATDACEGQAAAASAGDSGRTLPNGRPFPGKGANGTQPPGRPPQNRVIIQFTPDSSQQDRNAYIREINGRSRRQIDRLNVYAVTLPANQSPENLPASPVVVRAEPDYIAGASLQSNDPRVGEQWAIAAMNLPERWAVLPPNAPTLTVAVIDSGVCTGHADLAGRTVAGYDFVDGDNDPQDSFGHGCAVAGVIAAGVNDGVGMAGAAPNTRIMPLRVLDSSGLGDYSAISEAIVYAADNGADIINLSLAGGFNSQVMADAVAYAQGRGVTVVASAGNFGSSTPAYPAGYTGVISVGALDPTLERSSFSNYGETVSVYAPGRDILGLTPAGDYDYFTGTSFAAPLVAGLVAINRTTGDPLPNGVIAVSPAGGGC